MNWDTIVPITIVIGLPIIFEVIRRRKINNLLSDFNLNIIKISRKLFFMDQGNFEQAKLRHTVYKVEFILDDIHSAGHIRFDRYFNAEYRIPCIQRELEKRMRR